MKTIGEDPVFPSVDEVISDGRTQEAFGHNGLTKHEHFAAIAMQGILANATIVQDLSDSFRGDFAKMTARIAMLSVSSARALIDEINMEKP